MQNLTPAFIRLSGNRLAEGSPSSIPGAAAVNLQLFSETPEAGEKA